METNGMKEKLMDYLYGELSPEEQVAFENNLNAHPELLQELNELRNTRSQMAMKDKEVLDPFLVGQGGNSMWVTARVFSNVLLKPAMGLAAAISLVLLIGYVTSLDISTQDGYLNVSFGKQQQPDMTQYVSKAEFVRLMDEVQSKESTYETRLASMERDVQSVDTRVASIKEPGSTMNESQQLSSLALQLQKDNLRFLEQYMAQTATSQERLIEGMLRDFSSYLEEQREQDLRNIQYSLQTLKANQEQSMLETNEVLASIITKVSNQNN